MQPRQNIAPVNDWISVRQALDIQGTLVRKNLIHLLPTELKMKILESLPGVGIARVSCVDSEFRNLASDNDLWKQKCLEEFADSVIEEREFRDDFVDWKAKFVECWRRNNRKARKRPRRVVSCNPFRDEGFPGRGWERGSGSTAATSVLSLW